ncbi:MAG: hypothetical protein AAF390_18915, partial [Pseudomonadota bacterium]
STHNSRVFYAPALNAAAFARGEILRVDEVFENVADTTVRALYEASVAPLTAGMNRFNYEFLTEATAVPGSAR